MKFLFCFLSAVLLWYTAAADEFRQSAEDVDVIALYDRDIRLKPTGIYAVAGHHFFHQRIPVERRGGMFARIRTERAAAASSRKAVFEWLSLREKERVAPDAAGCETMRQLAAGVPGIKRVVRKIDFPCRILGNEEGLDGYYVYAIVISDAVLTNEVSKGCFETRPGTVRENWRRVVKSLIDSLDKYDFFVAFGVCDLVTLTAADKQGVRCLKLEDVSEKDACNVCIDGLRKAVSEDSVAGREYVELLGRMPDLLDMEIGEVDSFSNASSRIRVMLRSYASCPAKKLSAKSEDVDRCVGFLEGAGTPDMAMAAFLTALNSSPGSELMWIGLGEAFLRKGKPALAAASFRNALRLDRKNAYATDRMAEAYRRLNCRKLAEGLALLSFGLTEQPEFLKYSSKILNVPEKWILD